MKRMKIFQLVIHCFTIHILHTLLLHLTEENKKNEVLKTKRNKTWHIKNHETNLLQVSISGKKIILKIHSSVFRPL